MNSRLGFVQKNFAGYINKNYGGWTNSKLEFKKKKDAFW